MRGLQNILQLFECDCAMDYCQEFDEIKSVLEYYHKNVTPFNKLHFRSGNDAFINELRRRLQDLLIERNLVDPESKAPLPKAYKVLRKIMIFLLANTDATYKYNLRDDTNLVHVLEICPLMPKFLLVALVWELQLDIFFYEVISFTPCWFSFQYIETASDSLKYIDDPYAVLEKVENLVKAIFTSVTRSQLRDMDKVDHKIICGKLCDGTMNLLRQFYTPEAEKFKQFKKYKFYHYTGFALKHILQMVLFAFDVYESSAKAEPVADMTIYDICQSTNKVIPKEKAQKSDVIDEHQLKIITALLNTLEYNVRIVRIDVFMYWVEIDLTPMLNLQMNIGEMAYKVGERMQANPAFRHEVEQQLKMIAITPKSLEETIQGATLGDILRSLDEPLPNHIKRAWFSELFNRNIAFGNTECLQTVRENMKLMDVEHCKKILDYIKLDLIRNETDEQELNEEKDIKIMLETPLQMIVDSDEYEEVTSLILDALLNFSNEQIIQLLNYQIKLFGHSTNTCRRSDTDFQINSTEFLNKIPLSSSFDMQQFLILCFENPAQMWAKLFDSACHSSVELLHFVATVKQTRPFSDHYVEMLVLGAISDSGKMQKKCFSKLLCEMYFIFYHDDPNSEFLKETIPKIVSTFLSAHQFDSLLPIIQTLNLIDTHNETQSYKPLNFGDTTAAILLMVAQIMNKSRWDLITYTNTRDDLVKKCIEFIQHVSKKFLPQATERDRKYITKVVSDSYRPTTQYYFQKFALKPEQPNVDFDRFLMLQETQNQSESVFLITNYVRCTMKETEWLARSESLLPHISDVILLLCAVVKDTGCPNAINCYRAGLTNYANILIKILLPRIEKDTKKCKEQLFKLLQIINSTPDQIYEEVFANFENFLSTIIMKCEQPLQGDAVKAIEQYVSGMKACLGKTIFLEKFQALVNECNA